MNMDLIFDTIGKIDKYSQFVHAIKVKTENISYLLSNICGNCSHWMKSSCTPEKKYGIFKSCGSCGCKDFELSSTSLEISEKLRCEILRLREGMLEVCK